MLRAYTNENKEINLIKFTCKEKLHRIKEENEFYCPWCKEKVILKIGNVMIPHFAHIVKSNCKNTNESLKHRQGKRNLSMWLTYQGIDHNVEVVLKEINRIADIYFVHNNKKYVIEYQCSTIPVTDVVKRSDDYKSIGITPIWILGKKVSTKIITDFELAFENRGYILYYDNDFYIKYVYANYTKNKFIAHISKYMRDELKLYNIVYNKYPADINCSYFHNEYKEKLSDIKNRTLMSLIKYDRKFAMLIYTSGIHNVHNIGIEGNAFKKQYVINESPIVWQIYIQILFFRDKKMFSKKELYHFIYTSFKMRRIYYEPYALKTFVDDYLRYMVKVKKMYVKGEEYVLM